VTTQTATARDRGVDTLRGLAIVLMVAANAAPGTLVEPYPLWYKVLSSLAAPLFVTISGLMVCFTARTRGYPFSHYIKRGALVLLAAALLDLLVWLMVPATSFDVLYLIGISLPLAYLAARAGGWVPWVLAAAVFAATPFLQSLLGYCDYPVEIYFFEESTFADCIPCAIATHYLVDGWFPLFPWLGFAFVGAGLAGVRDRGLQQSWWFPVVGLVLLAGGVALWISSPGEMLSREGYAELFYPSPAGFMPAVTGFIFLAFWAVSVVRLPKLLDPVWALGEVSITIYVAHLALIGYVVEKFFEPSGMCALAVHYTWIMALMLALAYGLRAYRKRGGRPRNSFLRMFAGG